MSETLRTADREQGYFMTDRSTWVIERRNLDGLALLFRGDPGLVNVYHGLCSPANASDRQPQAAPFLDSLVSAAGQGVLRRWGLDRYGKAPYHDAE